jgi:YesN/AraC family two-component response regulator
MIYSSYAEKKQELAGIKIVSCGHIFAAPGREICRPSGRDDWLLFYVAKESETFFLKSTVRADAGSVIIYAPGEPQHHIHEGSKIAEFYYVHFQCASLPDQIKLKTSHIYSVKADGQFDSMFEEMIEEALQKKPDYELICLSSLLRMLSIIQREQAQGNDTERSFGSIANAVLHIKRHCESNQRLEDYAAMCCLSKYHFSRLFKEATGASPIEYRNSIRIEHAKELLQNSYFSICEIGEMLGYTSASYFSDCFKKATGVSPAEYRKK